MIRNFVARLGLICAAATLLAASFPAGARTIRFVTDKEKEGGFLIEVTKAAMARAGHDVEIEFLPWARALYRVMNGQSEALLGVYHNEERAQKMLYTEVVGRSDMVFFKLKSSNIVFNSLEDLRPYAVGTIIGASYPPEFENASFIRKDPVSDYTANIRKLLAGRVGLFVEKKHVVLNALRTQFTEEEGRQIDILPVPLRENLYYNAFSKAYPDYERNVADFNRGLKMIIDDGTYAKIMGMRLHE